MTKRREYYRDYLMNEDNFMGFDRFRDPIFADDSRWVDPRRRDDKGTHPYSYSEFFHWGSRKDIEEADDGLYSDRIFQWDHEKASECWKKHIRGRWEHATPKEISAFLSEYLERPVVATALAEGCNASNGYPYFIVWLKYLDGKKKKKA